MWGVAFEKAVRRKPLAFAADAGLGMEFQLIFARKALPGAGFSKTEVVDAYHFSHDSLGFKICLILTRHRSFFKLATLQSTTPHALGTRQRPPRQRPRSDALLGSEPDYYRIADIHVSLCQEETQFS